MLNAWPLSYLRRGSTGGGGGTASYGAVSLLGGLIAADPGNSATLRVDASGFEHQDNGDGSPLVQPWIVPQVGMNKLEVRATVLSGVLSGPSPVSEWVSLDTSREWSINSGRITRSVTLRVEIRDPLKPGFLLTSAVYTLEAQGVGEVF